MQYTVYILFSAMPTAAERYNFAEVEIHGKNFISETLKLCKVYQVQDNVTKIGTKDVVVQHLVHALQLIERQQMFIVNQRVYISSYQKDIIKLQDKVIDAQNKVMDKLTTGVTEQLSDQLCGLTNQLTTTVKDTVKDTVKSYSEAAQPHAASGPNPVITPGTLKSVAKQVVAEEELSKNVMLFNLVEQENEDLGKKVSDVFLYLGEKPRIEARRVGTKKKSSPRPVKVTLSSSSTATQILVIKSRNLRKSEDHKAVFVTPDRTFDQRAEQRKLVLELKKKKADSATGWRHYIKDGKIVSVECDSKT